MSKENTSGTEDEEEAKTTKWEMGCSIRGNIKKAALAGM